MKKINDFKRMCERKEPIVMLTAYDFPSAKQAEHAGVDMILVGDSLGMVVLGYDSTIPVTVEDMIHHTKAVRRGAGDTFVVTDMPFMSYHCSLQETMQTARRMMQEAGANAIKLEGAGEVITTISKLNEAGVPVVAHLGLTPQSVAVLGGYYVQGKELESAKKLFNDAKEIEAAGAIALVLECVPKQLAEKITNELNIPVIGIGAGCETDGQVLVYHDVLGYGSAHVPKFVKKYSNINEIIHGGLSQYIDDVRTKKFPDDSHSFLIKDDQLKGLYGGSHE